MNRNIRRNIVFITILAFAALAMAIPLHEHHQGECQENSSCIFCAVIQSVQEESASPIFLSNLREIHFSIVPESLFCLYETHILPFPNGPPCCS